jgi:hypothetical protein
MPRRLPRSARLTYWAAARAHDGTLASLVEMTGYRRLRRFLRQQAGPAIVQAASYHGEIHTGRHRIHVAPAPYQRFPDHARRLGALTDRRPDIGRIVNTHTARVEAGPR